MFQEWKKVICKPLKILDIFISITVISTIIFLIVYWKHIPEQVPQHWNAAGEIDDYADAGSYIMLVIIMFFCYAGHQLTKLIPTFDWKENIFGKDLVNKVSKETAAKAINVFMGMLWGYDILVQIMFAYIIVCGVLVRNLGVWFLPLTFILLAADFIWFGATIVQIKNSVRES